MKQFLVLAAFICGTAHADQAQYLKGEALQAEVQKLCADGCIVFNASEIAQLQANIEAHVRAQMEAAYAAGKAAGKTSSEEMCRNKIKGTPV